MIVTIGTFTCQPSTSITGSSCVLRLWYNQSYLDSTGQLVQSGTATTGNQYRVTCTISGGIITVPPLTLYSTLDAQVPYPQSINISASFFKGNSNTGATPFNQNGTPASWIIPDDLGASISFEEWTIANQRIVLTNPPQTFYTASEVDALINAAVDDAALNQDVVIGDYASFAAAVSAIGSTATTLVINQATSVTANTTVPSTLTLRFTRKGSITISNSVTLTVLGPIEADPVKIFFNATLTQGTVSFTGNTSMQAFYPQWWGMVTGASASNSAAFQACFAAMATAKRPKMLWTTGFFPQTTVPLRAWTGIEMTFEHASPCSDLNDSDTGLDYRGATGTAAIQWYNMRGSAWHGINIRINRDGAINQQGIDCDQFANGTVIDGFTITGQANTSNTFKNFLVLTDANGVSTCGVRIAYTSNDNCENITLDKVRAIFNGTASTTVTNLTRGSAFKVGGNGGGANVKNLRFLSPQWQMATYGIETPGGVSYSVVDGESQYASVDFKGNAAKALIERFRSENGRRFLSGNGSFTLVANEIASGNWDAAEPLVYVAGTSDLEMIGNVYDSQASIVSVDADTNGNCQFSGMGNSWAEATSSPGYPTLVNFSRGATSVNHTDKLGLYLGGKEFGNALRYAVLLTFAQLSNVQFGNGTIVYVTDALVGSNPCAGGGTGALVIRQNGVWVALGLPATIAVTGGITSSGTAGIGYATGAGGTVTQGVSKSTGVTLDKVTGTITMNNATLNAGDEVAFTLTNSTIAATDVVVVSIKSGATAAAYFTSVGATAAGSCSITLGNVSGGNLGEAVVLSFVVIKGVAA